MRQAASSHKYLPPPTMEELGLALPDVVGKRLSGESLPKMKKFRFQLLADWMVLKFKACRVADVGGGKGLLAFLLCQFGFDAVVVDPVRQRLPDKYKDLKSGRQIRIDHGQDVSRIARPFDTSMAQSFDVLLALHAHGCNLALIEAAAQYKKGLVVLPCCVIDEPAAPPIGKNWFMWLVEHATSRGLEISFFHLNFSGQNVGFYCQIPDDGR